MWALTTPRLVLRPFQSEDLAALESLYGDPRVSRHLENGPYRPAKAAKLARRALDAAIEQSMLAGYGPLAVVENDRLVGAAGVQPLPVLGPERLELSYLIAADRWGLGLATEAAAAVVGDAFGRLERDHLVAVTRPDNAASHRVLAKLGFVPAGTVRCYGRLLPLHALTAEEHSLRRSPNDNEPNDNEQKGSVSSPRLTGLR